MRQSIHNRLIVLAVLLLPMDIWAQEPEITVDLPGGVPLEMVWIEPETFTMGVPLTEENVHSTQTPQHQVILTHGFYLGKFEVTQVQWTAVMGTKPWDDSLQEDCPNCPVTWIS
jgi:formylglycine-generating enzyme required for sulfatase activity